MPPLPPAPGAMRLRFVGTCAGKNWANVLHVGYATGTPTAADLNTLATSFAGLWNTRFAPQIANTNTLTLTDLQDLSGPTGAYGSSNITHAGTASGNVLPNNTSCAVSWKIALHYRGGHPRTYLPPTTNFSQSDSRTWTGTYTTAVQTAMNGFITDVGALTSSSTGGLTLGVVSYYHNKQLRPQGLFYLFSSAVVHNRIDSMRRRLGKEVI